MGNRTFFTGKMPVPRLKTSISQLHLEWDFSLIVDGRPSYRHRLRMTSTDRKILLGFIAVSLVLRLACLNLNSAEYTDGILQITAFDYGFTFWPPIYTVAAKTLAFVVGDLEQAGKLVSILSSTLLLIPLYGLTFRLAGRRAAIYAVLFYMTNPIATRWSIRVMGDSLFNLLFFWAAALFLQIAEREKTDQGESGRIRASSTGLLAACLMAPLATLTRYQGILLVPLEWLALKAYWARACASKNSRRATVLLTALLPWLLVVVWVGAHSKGHVQQFAERTAGSLTQTLIAYWSLAESFIFLFPYFVTIPVFVLFACGLGLFFGGDRQKRAFAWAFVWFAVTIVAMQAAFRTFQDRYLLPLVPFMMVLAGVAAARWEERAVARRALVRAALLLFLCLCCVWTSAVLFLQREAFADVKQAARFCATLPRQSRIFSNEWFGGNRPAIKMSFWSERRVEGFDGSQPLAKGDYLCLHSGIYGRWNTYPALGPSPSFQERLAVVGAQYEYKQIGEFYTRIVPLLPDIMDGSELHTSPLAWFYRFSPQRFRTVVLQIEGPRSAR